MDTRGACSLWYSYEIRNAKGKIVKKSKPRISKSFVIAYARWLYLKFVRPTTQTITDTTGNSRSKDGYEPLTTTATSSTSTDGLVVGTGTNAVALADTALQTQIAHGTGAGQLSYGASVVNLPSSDSTSTSLIMTRVFSNGSGGTVTIREIGVYSLMPSSGTHRFCIIRDVVTIALANGDQLTLNYIMKTTV